jgi:hypothetical protein
MRLALVLLALALQDRSEALFEQVTIQAPEPASPEQKRILDVLTKKENWVSAFRAIEEKLGRFPDTLRVKVTFDWTGEEFAQGAGAGTTGVVRFNLPKLEEYLKKLDDLDQQRKDLARQGKRLVYKVPPARFDRIIYHELTHVLQAGYPAPDWFIEGMAVWLADDANTLYGFGVAGKKVESIETPLSEKHDCYARGHLFFKWLSDRGSLRKVARATLFERRTWKRALEDSTDLPWESLVPAELEWSEKEIEKFRALR